ncbi:MAG TPA: DJ-1/PfpI family protein [Actinophytocola sp.]|jgi:transcriptional regulator GlxA family with amidase domain|uniref:DJ-1/PfpI family protein n=1 Tax=Actinophytocola sp. TaxID=1872138 RepID=UPI002E081BE1|nr:DJ-1/PfpI family protein [Actinophytocola sp.]
MTIHKARMVGRFLLHYTEMVIAMMLGMLLLGLLWSAVLPEITRTDVDTLVMAANMTIGMAAWMRMRRHGWRSIGEMSVAMILPFLVLLVPYWFGVLPGHLVMSVGHPLMFVTMALAILWRRAEYTQHRHHIRPKWVWRAAVVLIALLVPAAVSAVNTIGKFGARYEARSDTVSVEPAPKAADHDPAKPTVAFLVGSKGSNAADLLGPYETLAGTGALNTYVVSAGARLVPLTGGLDLVPDLTFDGLAALLAERHDRLDAVVIPALQEPDAAERDAITTWLRQQSGAGALTVSVCNGARTLAESGLLDGRPATSHWTRLSGLRNDFRNINWVSGRRYVDDGNVITTAGVLSGIDGALRILERLAGTNTARAAADNVHWRHYSPGTAARIPESSWAIPDVVVALNASYQPGPSTIGVQLTGGTGELELASAFMSYTEQSLIGRTVAVGDGPIRSRHGLTFVPRSTVANAGNLDRLLVPGLDAARQHSATSAGPRPEYLHTTEEFAFDPVLRDIARTYDVQTARFAAKTLEYPVHDVDLTGRSWPWLATLIPILLALLGATAAIAAGIVFRRIRTTRTLRRPEPLSAPIRTAELSLTR